MLLPKPTSRAAEKVDARRQKEAQRRIVYRLVSKRDGFQCRNCGSRDQVHHHHLKFRSKGGQDTEKNLLLLCKICHDDVHGYRLWITGDDARHQVTFTRAR